MALQNIYTSILVSAINNHDVNNRLNVFLVAHCGTKVSANIFNKQTSQRKYFEVG